MHQTSVLFREVATVGLPLFLLLRAGVSGRPGRGPALAWWAACRLLCWQVAGQRWRRALPGRWHAWRRARVLRRLARQPGAWHGREAWGAGWFDSSLVLRDGLAVSEVAALVL